MSWTARGPSSAAASLAATLLLLSACKGGIGRSEYTGYPNWPMPDTAIDVCHDDAGETTCPSSGEPFYGQDAQYGTNTLDLVNNDDGTATDNVTGLMWQRQDDGELMFFTEASPHCEDLELAGYDDWRLPSSYELLSIIDYSRPQNADGAMLDLDIFPQATGDYWSGTYLADTTDTVWYLQSDTAWVTTSFTDGEWFEKRVLCVR
jgi:hypothetical protein